MPLAYEVRGTVCSVVLAIDQAQQAGRKASEYQAVKTASADLIQKIVSPEFDRYLSSIGKLVGMMPKNYPGVTPEDAYWRNYADVVRLKNAVKVQIELRRQHTVGFQSDLASLATALDIMDRNQEDIDAAFAKKH